MSERISPQEAIKRDAILQKKLPKVAKIYRDIFDAIYGVHDGILKNPSDVAALLGCPLVEVKIAEARSIVAIGEETLERLLDILSGKPVETERSIQARAAQYQEKRSELRQKKARASKIISLVTEKKIQLTPESAEMIWDSLTEGEQMYFFLRIKEKWSYEELANWAGVKSADRAKIQYRKLVKETGGDTIVDALDQLGVIKEPILDAYPIEVTETIDTEQEDS